MVESTSKQKVQQKGQKSSVQSLYNTRHYNFKFGYNTIMLRPPIYSTQNFA